MKKRKSILRDPCDTIRQTSVCFMGAQRRTEEKTVFKEILVENFPNLMKDMVINIQEVHYTLIRMKSQETQTKRLIIIKFSKRADLESRERQAHHHI